ncbi:type II toxin-antitoxin system VapB family antitoxin [Microlunatus speluncae]|uniref:type II toxin-antitoxin system VapB family antitoxin n=1 Tax=Microlunatus speluncae TaxID=2594267 RepID=UPI001375459E|nr:type II toxin-antitoxin system VapB family antitoxin [Microlunatus speluncae]
MKAGRGEFGPEGPIMVEVDPALLQRAKAVLGVLTARRAVELALREVIRRRQPDGNDRPRS